MSNYVHEPELGNNEYLCFDHDTNWLNKVYYSRMPDELTEMFLDYVQVTRNDENRVTANHQLAGQIQNEFYLAWQDDPIMRDAFSKAITYHFSNIARESITDLTVGSVWVNIMKPTEYNPIHTHLIGGVDWSFAWYLDCPEEMRQEWKNIPQKRLNNSIGMIQFMPTSQNAGETLTFNPRKGDLFIFRSDRPHVVYPFYSNNERISVAGNFANIKTISGRIL